MDLFGRHGRLNRRNTLGFGVVSLNFSLKAVDLQLLSLKAFLHLTDGVHSRVKLLRERIKLLFGCCQLRRLVGAVHDLGVNDLGKALGHLLRARPIHILDEQIASDGPELRIRLEQHRHGVEGFLTLGHVAGASCDAHVVHAHRGVVDLVDHAAVLIADLLDGFGLHGVDLDHADFAVETNDAGHTFGVVNLRDQID